LLSEKTIKLKDLSNILKSAGFKKVPTLVIPNFLLRFLALFTPSLKMIAKRLGKEEKLHTANANNVLGWYPNRVELEIINSAKQLYETGLLKN
jgi:hypothetical protein